MKKLEKDVLIPFKLHTKGKCDSCRKNIRELFKRGDALIHQNGLEFISLNSFSTFMHKHLNRLRDLAIDSQTAEDYSFYAAHATMMVNDWILFGEDIINMAADSCYSTIKNDLLQAWEKVNTELKGLVDHFISAHEILLHMGAPAPTVEILKDYAEGHQKDDCE
jgi:hypothetical protein